MPGKKFLLFIAALLAVNAALLPLTGESARLSAKAAYEVGFSPGGSAQRLVIRAIGESRREILVACYEFTDRDVAAAIEAAAHRGVKVRIVADDGAAKAKYSQIRLLGAAGIPIRLATRYAIMHDKFMVIDGSTVETGSFNYSVNAVKSNAENVLVIRDAPELAADYAAEWQRLWDEAKGGKRK